MNIERLAQRLQQEFPERGLTLSSDPRTRVIFPALHPDVGDIEIEGHGDEIILWAGHSGHGHFACFQRDLPSEEKEREVIEQVVAFLRELFSDQVVMWGSRRGTGGHYRRGSRPPQAGFKEYVWSGPLTDDA